MSVTRKWSLMAAVLALAILAAGWFLLVSPKRTEAADLRQETVSQQDANDRLVQQLEVLKAQQAELPQQRARLAVMRTQIPDNPALPTLIRDLTTAGRKVGVSIDEMTPAVPVAVVADLQPVAPVATTQTTGTDSGSESSEATGTTDAGTTPVAAPAAPAPSLYQVPLTLKVSGSYFELEQFVNKLEGLKRSFLVSGFSLTPADAAAAQTATGDGPTPGDLKLEVTGRVFISPAGATTAATTQPTAAPAAPAQ